MSTSTVYNHSRVCYFGLAKPVGSTGILPGDRQKVKGTVRNETGCPPCRPQPSSQGSKTDRRHSICGKLASWFYSVLEIKISACLFFGGLKGPNTNFLKGVFLGTSRSLGPMPRLGAVQRHMGPLLWIWSACPGREELRRRREHSEGWLSSREAHPGPGRLHGLGARRQFEESGCGHELAYVSLLRDAGLLEASVGQRRHLAQGAEPRFREGAGVHGQADGDQPIRHGRDAAGREGLPADLCEAATGDLDGERKQSEEAPHVPSEGRFSDARKGPSQTHPLPRHREVMTL